MAGWLGGDHVALIGPLRPDHGDASSARLCHMSLALKGALQMGSLIRCTMTLTAPHHAPSSYIALLRLAAVWGSLTATLYLSGQGVKIDFIITPLSFVSFIY